MNKGDISFMEFYYDRDDTVLDKYARILVPTLKGQLLNTLNNELVMELISNSVYSFVDLDYKNKQLYFIVGINPFNNHKRRVVIYKVHPVLLGKVKLPFFKGYNPFENGLYDDDDEDY